MDVKLIQVSKNNIEALRLLVRRCFPLTYTEALYMRIYMTWNKYSRFAVVNGVIVGAIISRVDPVLFLEEDPKSKPELAGKVGRAGEGLMGRIFRIS